MPIEIYEDDDVTLASGVPITNLDAGADSDPVELHVWNDIGNSGGQTRPNVRLDLGIEDPENPGSFLADGYPPLDQLWGRWRVIGYDNTGDPTFAPPSTDYRPWGAYAQAFLGSIPPNCAVYIEVLMHPPSSATEMAWTWAVIPVSDEYSVALPMALGLVERGILHGVGEWGHSGLVRGGAVTPSGSPDDQVHVAAIEYVYRGVLYGFIVSDHTLNQNDGAAAALGVGESYIAVGTVNASGPHWTKGLKGSSPVAPTPPAGEPLLPDPYVLVQYDAGGGAIEAADITGDGVYDRFYVEAGSGLQIRIHPGRELGLSTFRYSTGILLASVEASTTNYLWRLSSGLPETTTTETPPESEALGPLAEIDTDGSGVTAIRDRRTYAGRSVTLVLKGAYPGSAAPQLVDEVMIEHERLYLETVALRLSDNGGGSSGQTQADVRKNGTTVFTGYATEDQRPAIPYNATELVARGAIAEVREFRRGDVVGLYTVEDPTGGNPARIETHLTFRIP